MWVRSMFGAVVLLGAGVGYLAYSQWQYDQRSKALDADIATLNRLRWERPPLRGPAVEGNAAEGVFAALAAVEPLAEAERAALAESLHYGQALPAPVAQRLTAWQEPIAKLRDATHGTWSATRLSLEAGTRTPVPDYPLVMDAALMMLGQALGEGGDGCLTLVADTIRMGQDLVAGAPLQASSVAMRIASVGARVVGYCTAGATGPGLRRASGEFRMLATEGPPTGVGIEVADLIASVELRRQAAITAETPYAELVERVRARGLLFSAWAALAQPSRWRNIVPEAYPDAVSTWRAEQDFRTRSADPAVATATEGVLEWLYDDQRGQAILRALALGMSTLAERERRGKTPHNLVGAKDSALRDPYTGGEMRFRFAQDGGELTIWSVGEDLRDDRGTDEWSAQAPLDVTVHLRMAAVGAERDRARKRGGRRIR